MTSNNNMLGLALAGSLVLGAAASYAADLPSPIVLASEGNDATIPQVEDALQALGYSDIGPMTHDGTIFETTATWQGDTFILRVDASSGAVTDAAATPAESAGLPSPILLASEGNDATVPQVEDALRVLGYSDIGPMTHDGTIFETTAMWQGNPVKLRIDASSGVVTNAAATPSDSAGLPSPIILASEGNDATIPQVEAALQVLGYSDIGPMTHDGTIFETKAMWQGEAVNLRIDASSGAVIAQ